MFSFILKNGAYFIFWQKFREQFITLLISFVFIVMVLSIYNDLLAVLQIVDSRNLFLLLLFKWLLIIITIGINIYKFRAVKTKEIRAIEKKDSVEAVQISSYKKKILEKEVLLNTTDLILAKYKKRINEV